jgi:hypothetical protein
MPLQVGALLDRSVRSAHGHAVAGPDLVGGLCDPLLVGGPDPAAGQLGAQVLIDVDVGVVGVRRRRGVDRLLGNVLNRCSELSLEVARHLELDLQHGTRRRIRYLLSKPLPARSPAA